MFYITVNFGDDSDHVVDSIGPSPVIDSNESSVNRFEDKEIWENPNVILSRKCVFCTKRECKQKGIRQRLIQSLSEAKKSEILLLLTEECQIENYNTENQTSGIIFYHTMCFNNAKRAHSSNNNEIDQQKSHSSRILTDIKVRVQQQILIENGIRSLAELYEEYSILFEEGFAKDQISDHRMVTPQQLLRKLLNEFPNLSTTVSRNRTFIHSNHMSNEEVQCKVHFTGSLSAQIKTVAYEIRKVVLGMEHRSMPKRNISLNDVLNGESDCPSELRLLIECLVKGVKRKVNQRKDTRIAKICDDLIFTITNGKVKPASIIELGIVTKSITSSRKMIEILNRMGHCCSYSLVEGMETELAYGNASKENLLPFGLKDQQPQLYTHVAFDNFDRYVETSTGKDTLHDTVGIVYQNKSPCMEIRTSSEITDNSNNNNIIDHSETGLQRRKKYFSNFDDSIPPFIPLHPPTRKLIGNDPKIPNNWTAAHDLDNVWMYYFKFCLPNAKRWFAWNADRVRDENPPQVIGYLPNLNRSPTNDAVVMKTLEMANQIADECNQKYIVVTYDLAIAMKAYNITDCMSPRFDRIFVNLGGFHIEMSYFKVCIIGAHYGF